MGNLRSKEIKLHSKLSALDNLGKHFGVFEKDNSLKQTKPCVIVDFANIDLDGCQYRVKNI